MPETKLKPLYLGKSIADLATHYEINETIKGKKATLLGTSACKLFEEAVKYRISGDEERSYVCYMKYLTIVTMVQGSPKYMKEWDNFTKMLGAQNIKNAINIAEELKSSLERRYELMKKQQEFEDEQLAQEEGEAKDELKRNQVTLEKPAEDTNPVNGIPGADDVSISSTQLYHLLSEKKINLLILDSRPATCYAQSHMTLGNCINVPEEIVKAGTSAAGLEKLLPPESRLSWSQRKEADLIVLLDWSTTEKSHRPGTNLYILKNILSKWDPGIIYKSAPLILDGGYEEWLLRYPMHTTNPQVKPPVDSNASELDDLLDDVEYPNLMEFVQPVVDRTSKPTSSGKGSLLAESTNTIQAAVPGSVSEGHPGLIRSSSNKVNSIIRPGVDRRSKAVALQTYEDRSRVVAKLLHGQEKLASESQKLEESKLDAQKECELLRISKEKEADEERVQLLQKREEELLLSITKLEDKQRAQEAEKQALRDQLEQYKHLQEKETEKPWSQMEEDVAKEEERKRPVKEWEERKLPHQEKNQTGLLNNFKLLMKPSEERRRMKDAEKTRKLEEEKRKEKERERQEHEKGTYYTQLKSDMSSSSGTMKRCRSVSDIPQMGVEHKPPHFDRAIKPLQRSHPSEIKAARQRDFNAVWGHMGHGITGLKNLGNSCYMNSIIQCINNTTPLVSYFCEGNYREDVNHHNNSTRGEVAEEVAAVVRALWSGEYRSIACRDLKSVVGQHRKQFQGYEQQDSHEFLTILMDWLHEDLNKGLTTGPYPEPDESRPHSPALFLQDPRSSANKTNSPQRSKKSPLKEASNALSPADQAWDKFQRCNESLIRSLFYGQQKSTVCCCKCSEESVTFEAFSDLSLPLPSSSNKCSLSECLKLYLNGEKISGWNCPSCKEKRDAIKKFDIWRLPPVLVIHLNRFYHDGWWRKRQTYVDFPFNMDMRRITLIPDQRYVSYNLYGVSNHYGTMEGGHYTAYCKNAVYDKWYKFDDHEVSEISNNDVRSGAAYILFYTSVEYKVPGSSNWRTHMR